MILLDVVMEHKDAGLQLVNVIRNELGLSKVRIILRTGQPVYAPEIEAIRDFNINDYKTKAELTRTKLFATITAAIRSYEQIGSIKLARLMRKSVLLTLQRTLQRVNCDSGFNWIFCYRHSRHQWLFPADHDQAIIFKTKKVRQLNRHYCGEWWIYPLNKYAIKK